MFARFLFYRHDGIAFIRRDDLAIERIFDALDILVSADFHCDLRVFGQRFGEEIIGQEEQRHRNRRAQGGAARRRLAIAGGDVQREIVTPAIGRHIRAHGDDVLAAEQEGEVAEDCA